MKYKHLAKRLKESLIKIKIKTNSQHIFNCKNYIIKRIQAKPLDWAINVENENRYLDLTFARVLWKQRLKTSVKKSNLSEVKQFINHRRLKADDYLDNLTWETNDLPFAQAFLLLTIQRTYIDVTA